MMRPSSDRGGDAPAFDRPQPEPAPGLPAPQKLTMSCHLVQVKWTKSHFENLKYSIIEYAKDLIHINDVRGFSVTRKSIMGYWNQLIWTLYGEGNATCNRLESQVSSPRTDDQSCLVTDRVLCGRRIPPDSTNSASRIAYQTIRATQMRKGWAFGLVRGQLLATRTRRGLAWSSWIYTLIARPRLTAIGNF